jgi:hypothetical protein
MFVPCLESRTRSLGDLIATGNELDKVGVGLFKADIRPAPNDTIARYIDPANEADYSGYTRHTTLLAWSGPFNDLATFTAFVLSTEVLFPASDPSPADFVSNVIYGYFLYHIPLSGDPTELVGAERFTLADGSDAPRPVASPLGVVACVPTYAYAA